MEEVETVQDLADLIWRTPRGLKLRTVDDETYIAMIRKSHAENRWGELYDGWEKDIPPQYEHRGPSLAEEAEREKQAESKTPAVDVASLTVPQLRAALRTLGLEDSGTKLELRERLAGASWSQSKDGHGHPLYYLVSVCVCCPLLLAMSIMGPAMTARIPLVGPGLVRLLFGKPRSSICLICILLTTVVIHYRQPQLSKIKSGDSAIENSPLVHDGAKLHAEVPMDRWCQYIKPVTAAAGNVSWALMKNPDGLPCDVFITHAWAEGLLLPLEFARKFYFPCTILIVPFMILFLLSLSFGKCGGYKSHLQKFVVIALTVLSNVSFACDTSMGHIFFEENWLFAVEYIMLGVIGTIAMDTTKASSISLICILLTTLVIHYRQPQLSKIKCGDSAIENSPLVHDGAKLHAEVPMDRWCVSLDDLKQFKRLVALPTIDGKDWPKPVCRSRSGLPCTHAFAIVVAAWFRASV
eukprot:g19900.t1